jgi:hypothetical protein
MIETALLANAAVSVVANYLKGGRGADGAPASAELPPEVMQALDQLVREHEDSPGVVELSREAARPDRPQTVKVAPELGAAALAISPGDVFREARAQNRRVFMVGLVLGVTLASVLVIGIGGVIVSGVFLGKGSAAAAFGGVTLLDVVGLTLTKPFAVIQGASVTNQRLDLAHLRLQEQLADCDRYADTHEQFRCKTEVWDKTQEELRNLSGG